MPHPAGRGNRRLSHRETQEVVEAHPGPGTSSVRGKWKYPVRGGTDERTRWKRNRSWASVWEDPILQVALCLHNGGMGSRGYLGEPAWRSLCFQVARKRPHCWCALRGETGVAELAFAEATIKGPGDSCQTRLRLREGQPAPVVPRYSTTRLSLPQPDQHLLCPKDWRSPGTLPHTVRILKLLPLLAANLGQRLWKRYLLWRKCESWFNWIYTQKKVS